jgi:hypothetical protein
VVREKSKWREKMIHPDDVCDICEGDMSFCECVERLIAKHGVDAVLDYLNDHLTDADFEDDFCDYDEDGNEVW